MQIVFQDPYASLNPRWTIKDIVGEPLLIHGPAKRQALYQIVLESLMRVGLSEDHMNRFPHEFSGGQRQRICIAKALTLRPKFMVLDEPTSSLDVSVQAQVLNILKDLQAELGLTYLFISHNLSVIRHMSDTIGVMYLGEIVEIGSKSDLFKEQLHPYTEALFAAIPIPDPEVARERKILTGEVPNPTNPPKGCRFHPRCEHAKDKCREVRPTLVDVGSGRRVACHI
jgi:oligopeptide/dipeptide ABC transporter ATP-binding protein